MKTRNIEHRSSNMEPPTAGRAPARWRSGTRFWMLNVLAVAVSLWALSADAQRRNNSAQRTNSSSVNNTDDFGIIAQRNIFNPYRSGTRIQTFRPDKRPTTPRQTPYFALVGTMSYPKGVFAFFDGTSTDYKKVLAQGATINGYTVAEIAPNGVKLATTNGSPIEMKVGTQMRYENGAWKLPEGMGSSGDSGASATSGVAASPEENSGGSTAVTAPEETPPSAEGNDVLRKLMEQRQKELQ
jgi:hypothetical protein